MSNDADDQNLGDDGADAQVYSQHRFSPLEEDDHQPSASSEARNFDTIKRIPVLVQVVLGSATMPVAALMKLGRGAVVPLDHRVGEPVDVVVNGRVIARGEVVVVEDDNSRFGVQLTEIVGPSTDDLGG
ncbi:flagellar motor switch protein FliN [Pseudochelatococcus sp. G4_1912]|uniref:flagellar motor switch protein FliN n=1 Tax=Pseudochelatococcus sp. G4_1912 TaxID=3114288 RepID=UPI0039C5B8A8